MNDYQMRIHYSNVRVLATEVGLAAILHTEHDYLFRSSNAFVVLVSAFN